MANTQPRTLRFYLESNEPQDIRRRQQVRHMGLTGTQYQDAVLNQCVNEGLLGGSSPPQPIGIRPLKATNPRPISIWDSISGNSQYDNLVQPHMKQPSLLSDSPGSPQPMQQYIASSVPTLLDNSAPLLPEPAAYPEAKIARRTPGVERRSRSRKRSRNEYRTGSSSSSRSRSRSGNYHRSQRDQTRYETRRSRSPMRRESARYRRRRSPSNDYQDFSRRNLDKQDEQRQQAEAQKEKEQKTRGEAKRIAEEAKRIAEEAKRIAEEAKDKLTRELEEARENSKREREQAKEIQAKMEAQIKQLQDSHKEERDRRKTEETYDALFWQMQCCYDKLSNIQQSKENSEHEAALKQGKNNAQEDRFRSEQQPIFQGLREGFQALIGESRRGNANLVETIRQLEGKVMRQLTDNMTHLGSRLDQLESSMQRQLADSKNYLASKIDAFSETSLQLSRDILEQLQKIHGSMAK